jgi:hypothetical protein
MARWLRIAMIEIRTPERGFVMLPQRQQAAKGLEWQKVAQRGPSQVDLHCQSAEMERRSAPG